VEKKMMQDEAVDVVDVDDDDDDVEDGMGMHRK